MKKGPALFTISPDRPFARALVRGIIAESGDDPATLSRRLVLLPTRRACRAVREAFLDETGGKPLLLPRLQPLGDVDADEMSLSADAPESAAIPPAMPSLRRNLLLAQLIAARESGGFQPERHIALAKALGRLMDQTYTENLSLSNLPGLVEGTDFADHWQITAKFLTILSETWPAILAAEGMIDAADRCNRLILALADHWESNPPDYQVLAAGSTGSIPATGRLLGVIARMPQGAVVLPGLDQIMTDADWHSVAEGHAQATLKQLLSRLECERADVRPWHTAPEQPPARVLLASEIMRPADTADQWQRLVWPKEKIEAALSGLSLIETDTPQEEADSIALLLRETLETREKTALVITPDRTLARRVIASMERWGVTLDDSAGRPLFQTQAARFFLSVAEAVTSGLKPSVLLAALKSPLCCTPFKPCFVVRLETDLLRGLTPPDGPDGLLAYYHQKMDDPKERRKPDPALIDDLERLSLILSPFYGLMKEGSVPLGALIEAHTIVCEMLATADTLWADEDGQALAGFLSELRLEAETLPPIAPQSYPALLQSLMSGHTVRPPYGTHPRLSIMGQLEARLVHADRIILSGLNEGIWPPDAGTDPFLSRPMKRDFGLPPAERSVGLSAHDFVQGFCAGEVYLTRSRTVNGAPAIPARWLSRLETVLNTLGTSADSLAARHVRSWQDHANEAPAAVPVNRPSPAPHPAIRPDRLSVTKIETWMKDPYAIYAQYILGLTKLKPLEQEPDAAGRGNFVHAVLEEFVARTSKTPLPADAEDLFLQIARQQLPAYVPHEADRALLWPRIVRMAGWLIEQEREWRKIAIPSVREAHTSWTFQVGSRPFTLSGIADRIDRLKSGGAAIIDYKSGGAGSYIATAMTSGKLPQLPLEALMLREGAFTDHGVPDTKTGTLSYWVITGGKTPGTVNSLTDEAAIDETVRAVEDVLYDLVKTYEQPETPYISLPVPARAPRFNDYAHLARIQEWTALDEGDEAA